MPNTPKMALPYPSVSNAPNVVGDITALATAIDDKLGANQTVNGNLTVTGTSTLTGAVTAKATFQAGIKQCAVTTGGTQVTVPVVFSQAFAAIPIITVTPDTGTATITQCNISSPSTTGFNIVFNRTTTTSTGVHWQAMSATQPAA